MKKAGASWHGSTGAMTRLALCDCSDDMTVDCIHRLNMEFILAPCAQLHSLAKTPQPPPPPIPRIWAYIRGRYWSAKIDDISL